MKANKIIIIRPDHLGDLILSLPVAQALKERYPGSHITYFAAPGPAEIAPMVDYVDDWIIDKGPNDRLSLGKLTQLLRQSTFDTLIELKPSWRTAAAGFLSGIPIRIGTSRRFYSLFYNRRVNLRRRGTGLHQSDLEQAMLGPLGIDVSGLIPTMTLPESIKRAGGKLVTGSIKGYIVIHPGSMGSAPNWPVDYYRELAKLILKETNFKVVITGLETNLGDFNGCQNLCGKTSLTDLAGVLGGASLFVSGGTGPLHLADALGTRSIAFFPRHSNIDERRWGPRRHPEGIMLPSSDDCRSSSVARCTCLKQIMPEAAFKRLRQILNLERRN
jgi:heptosyltransferase III